MIPLRIDYSHGISEGNCPNSQHAGVFSKIRVMALAKRQLKLGLDFSPLPGWTPMIHLRIDYSHGIGERNCQTSQRAGVFSKRQVKLGLHFSPLPGWTPIIPLGTDNSHGIGDFSPRFLGF